MFLLSAHCMSGLMLVLATVVNVLPLSVCCCENEGPPEMKREKWTYFNNIKLSNSHQLSLKAI